MNYLEKRRMPLESGEKRVPINLSVSSDTLKTLKKIGGGNRSAAVELLVKFYVERIKSF